MNVVYDASSHTFNVTVSTNSNVTATHWTLSIYQDGVLVAQNVLNGSGNFTANTAYGGISAGLLNNNIPVGGNYRAEIEIYNNGVVVASGVRDFTV